MIAYQSKHFDVRHHMEKGLIVDHKEFKVEF